jgi:hypothetical protein
MMNVPTADVNKTAPKKKLAKSTKVQMKVFCGHLNWQIPTMVLYHHLVCIHLHVVTVVCLLCCVGLLSEATWCRILLSRFGYNTEATTRIL